MALGTWVAIEADGPATAIDNAFAAIAAVEERLHPSQAGSDLQRLRDGPTGVRVGIHPMTFRVLSFARRLFALSGGVFDPCLPGRPGRVSDLELGYDAGGAPWARCSRPLDIDCGGVAKGYAIDRAVETLQAADCTGGLVNAGGDLRVFGRARQTILVRHADGRCEPVELGGGAIAVSDRDSARAPRGHRGYYRRGAPTCPARRFAAVHAADAMTADALTKCVLLCDPQQARAIVRALGGRVLG